MTVRGKTQEELDWLRLMIGAGKAGPQAVHGLWEHLWKVDDSLSAGRRAVQRFVGEECSHSLFSDETERIFEDTCAWLEKTEGADVLTWSDEDYPTELLHAGLAPAVLWIRGRRELLAADRLYITGTERPDAEGGMNARDFAAAAVQKGSTVVSGLSEGIEAQAVQGALAATGAVLVVQATGPDRIWPRANRELFIEVARKGLLVSAQPPGVVFDETLLPERRQLCVALSRAVLVVQAEAASPALDAARNAAELGRDVMAVPGSIHSPLYKGCLRLLRQGAALTETVADIVPPSDS